MTKDTVFDITKFEARDTAWLEVENIKGDGPLLVNGQPVRVEIRSPGSKEALNAQHKYEIAQNAKTFAAMRGKPQKETAEDTIQQRAVVLAAVTGNIENFPVAPLEIYNNPKLGWFTAQVEKFRIEWANF